MGSTQLTDEAKDHLHVSTTLLADAPVRIVIVARSRGGSSFMGELFNQHRQAFYVYEPMHGIEDQYYKQKRQATQLHIKRNDTDSFDRYQSSGVASLRHILDCDFAPLFPAEREHRPAMMSLAAGVSSSITKALSQCLSKLELKTLAKNYSQTLSSQCVELLGKGCQAAQIRAIKVVRLTMTSAEKLLRTDPNLFIIYLTRDPRASAYSRTRLWWKSLPIREVLLKTKYDCNRMAENHVAFQRLSREYPSRLKHVRYEDMALRPIEYARDIYKMIGYDDVPEYIVRWLNENTQHNAPRHNGNYHYITARNATQVVNAWRDSMDITLQHKLTELCKPILNYLKYDTSP